MASVATNTLPSLKSLAQSHLIESLDPHQRAELLNKILVSLSPTDLADIPPSILKAAADAHDAEAQMRACLEVLPELNGRLVVNKYVEKELEFGPNEIRRSNYSLASSYTIRPRGATDARSLDITASRGKFWQNETSSWNTLEMTYHTNPVLAASFTYENNSAADPSCPVIRSSALSEMFSALSDPIEYSPAVEVREDARAQVHASARTTLSEEFNSAREAHQKVCSSGCDECMALERREADLETELDPLDREVDYSDADEDLQTRDTVQRDRTFGRLVQMLVPWEIRAYSVEGVRDPEYLERTGREDDTAGDLIRGAAVAAIDLDQVEYD